MTCLLVNLCLKPKRHGPCNSKRTNDRYPALFGHRPHDDDSSDDVVTLSFLLVKLSFLYRHPISDTYEFAQVKCLKPTSTTVQHQRSCFTSWLRTTFGLSQDVNCSDDNASGLHHWVSWRRGNKVFDVMVCLALGLSAVRRRSNLGLLALSVL